MYSYKNYLRSQFKARVLNLGARQHSREGGHENVEKIRKMK